MIENESFTSALAERPRPPQSEPDKGQNMAERWGKVQLRRKTNAEQERYLYRIAKTAETVEKRFFALKAAGALHFCNSRHIVEKKGNDFLPVGAWNCGKKYCAVCANKKRVKLLRLFETFFCNEDKNTQGPQLLKEYDLALFTVTLKHTKRKEVYYKELGTHFRNALKYGAFKKIICGGFYNTEHDYTQNGHHIHRHALVMVPVGYDVINDYENLTSQLREQWKSRTGGSFQIDLKPLGYDKITASCLPRTVVHKNLAKHLLEITKYITKRDSAGLIDFKIIEAVEKNNRAKFYGRFGILHKIKELKLNQEREAVDEIEEGKKELFTCNIFVKFKREQITIQAKKRRRKNIYKMAGDNSPAPTHLGRPLNQIETTRGEEIKTWRKVGISYTCKNLLPFENTKEARKQFKESIALSYFAWRSDRAQKLKEGYTVDKWKENKKAFAAWNTQRPLTGNADFLNTFDSYLVPPPIMKYGAHVDLF